MLYNYTILLKKSFLLFILICAISLNCNYCDADSRLDVLTVQQAYPLSTVLNDSSGLLYFNKYFWTIVDNSNHTFLYRLDDQGKVQQKIRIKGVKNSNWEALAQDSHHVYIGDIGNNHGSRKYLCIYRLAKKDLPQQQRAAAVISDKSYCFPVVFNKEYASPFRKLKSHQHNMDFEALFVDHGFIYLMSKNWHDYQTSLYKVAKKKGLYTLIKVQTIAVHGFVTGADLHNHKLVIVGYRVHQLPFYSFLYVSQWHNKGPQYISNIKKYRILPMKKYEGITYMDNNTLFLSNEKSLVGDAAISKLKIPKE